MKSAQKFGYLEPYEKLGFYFNKKVAGSTYQISPECGKNQVVVDGKIVDIDDLDASQISEGMVLFENAEN